MVNEEKEVDRIEKEMVEKYENDVESIGEMGDEMYRK
jgi:hypothetical protein